MEEDETISVYTLYVDGTRGGTVENLSEVMDDIHEWLINLVDAPDRQTTFRVVHDYMTREKFDNLPEFEGW